MKTNENLLKKASLFLIVFLILTLLPACSPPQTKAQLEGKEIKTEPARIDNLDAALNDLTIQIVNSMTESSKKKIAVIEFSDLDGHVTEFGRFIAEELITKLFGTKKFEVVERQLLNKIIAEQKLTLSGVVDIQTAKELGRVLGVEAIVSGTTTDLVSKMQVNARIISAETGSVFAVAAVDILKDEAVTQLMNKRSSTPKIVTDEGKAPQTLEAGTIFVEDFDNADGRLEDRWDIVSGDWKVVEDRQADGTIGNVVEQTSATGNVYMLAKDGYNWVDYTMEYDIKLLQGKLLPIAIFRGQNGSSFYTWAVGYRISYIKTGWVEGGYEHLTQRVIVKFESGKWYHIKIKANADQFKCYIDDKLIHNISHGAYYKGTIGIGTAESVAHFDNIKVTLDQ